MAVLVLAGALAAAGCSDDANCGVGTAPLDGMTLTVGASTITYSDLTSLAGNDCPDLGDPSAPTSITIEGREVEGVGIITFCIPRPDRVLDGARSLGTPEVAGDLQIVDLTATIDGCTYGIVYAADPPGTATATGACANLTDPAGFALTVETSVSLEKRCTGEPVETATGTLAGPAAVLLRPGIEQ